MTVCLVGLGANLGDRAQSLDAAVAALRGHVEISRVSASGWHEFAPVGGPEGQAAFLNGAVRLETTLSPTALLALFRQIEDQLGRRRDARWDARTIDIDLLLYGEQVIQTPDLTVPHPRMSFRRFVLAPAAEVAGEMVHPKIGWTVAKLLDHLKNARHYVAIAGYWISGAEAVGGTDGTRLAARVTEAVGGRLIADPSGSHRLCRDPVPTWDVAIQFLDARQSRLSIAQWSPQLSPAISDFWFDQSLVHATALLSPDRLLEYERLWQAAQVRIVAPKLTVLIDATVESLERQASQRPDSPSRSMVGNLHNLLNQRFDAPGHGPTLRLPANDPERAYQELLAAIEAMR